MKEKESALFSTYIIDGISYDASPYEMLEECMDAEVICTDKEDYADILDESSDPPITSFTYSDKNIASYIEEVASHKGDRAFRMLYPDFHTRMKVAAALIERIWDKGHYRLEDIVLGIRWNWNPRPLGNMAAFYFSAKAASEYIYDLGCRIADFSYQESDTDCHMNIAAWIPEDISEDELSDGQEHIWIEDERKCPEAMLPDEESHIIYIPFDTSSQRLGGSLLAEMHGHNGGTSPHIVDPDYFMDCHEVIRELVEDGIIMAGATVSDGGLAGALSRMCRKTGARVNIKGIMSSYMDDDATRILFSEIPGIVIQVSDANFDYLDSQLLLQDIAYYPIGHPSHDCKGPEIENKTDITVAGILASLLNQATEGED